MESDPESDPLIPDPLIPSARALCYAYLVHFINDESMTVIKFPRPFIINLKKMPIRIFEIASDSPMSSSCRFN